VTQHVDDRLINGAKVMAEKMGRKSRVIIDVALALDVPEVSALRFDEGDRRVDDAVGRTDPTGDIGTVMRQEGGQSAARDFDHVAITRASRRTRSFILLREPAQKRPWGLSATSPRRCINYGARSSGRPGYRSGNATAFSL
jgi:hypothetical protein